MPSYQDSHWAQTEGRVARFIEKLGKMRAEDRSAEVMVEIAIQLMWLNAHFQELHTIVHRITDRE
jgi:hypothetical protein